MAPGSTLVRISAHQMAWTWEPVNLKKAPSRLRSPPSAWGCCLAFTRAPHPPRYIPSCLGSPGASGPSGVPAGTKRWRKRALAAPRDVHGAWFREEMGSALPEAGV